MGKSLAGKIFSRIIINNEIIGKIMAQRKFLVGKF